MEDWSGSKPEESNEKNQKKTTQIICHIQFDWSEEKPEFGSKMCSDEEEIQIESHLIRLVDLMPQKPIYLSKQRSTNKNAPNETANEKKIWQQNGKFSKDHQENASIESW